MACMVQKRRRRPREFEAFEANTSSKTKKSTTEEQSLRVVRARPRGRKKDAAHWTSVGTVAAAIQTLELVRKKTFL